MCDLANRQMRHQALCKTVSNHPANLPWIWRVLHCINLGNTWKPPVLMTQTLWLLPEHSEGDDQCFGSSVPVGSRCFPGLCNVKLVISRGRLAGWLLAVLHSGGTHKVGCQPDDCIWSLLIFLLWMEMGWSLQWNNRTNIVYFSAKFVDFIEKLRVTKFVWYESEITVFW